MSGKVTVEESTFAQIKKLKWAWTSDGGGYRGYVRTLRAEHGVRIHLASRISVRNVPPREKP